MKEYNALIEKRNNQILIRSKKVCTENHHIIPRCMGGNDLSDNMVLLTAREHFFAHVLLCKRYPKQYGLLKTVNMMANMKRYSVREYNSKKYAWIKELVNKSKYNTPETISLFKADVIDVMNSHGVYLITDVQTKPELIKPKINVTFIDDVIDVMKNHGIIFGV